jgi:hypothetical protein
MKTHADNDKLNQITVRSDVNCLIELDYNDVKGALGKAKQSKWFEGKIMRVRTISEILDFIAQVRNVPREPLDAELKSIGIFDFAVKYRFIKTKDGYCKAFT